jgi:hypothetical protein
MERLDVVGHGERRETKRSVCEWTRGDGFDVGTSRWMLGQGLVFYRLWRVESSERVRGGWTL